MKLENYNMGEMIFDEVEVKSYHPGNNKIISDPEYEPEYYDAINLSLHHDGKTIVLSDQLASMIIDKYELLPDILREAREQFEEEEEYWKTAREISLKKLA
jgi:hypothetical protein